MITAHQAVQITELTNKELMPYSPELDSISNMIRDTGLTGKRSVTIEFTNGRNKKIRRAFNTTDIKQKLESLGFTVFRDKQSNSPYCDSIDVVTISW